MNGGFSRTTDLSSPGPIGGTTPSTVAMTSGTFGSGVSSLGAFGSVFIPTAQSYQVNTLQAIVSQAFIGTVGDIHIGGVNFTAPNARLRATDANILLVRNAADDDAGAILGKLTTDTAATTGLVAGVFAATTTATLKIYDANGTAYNVAALPA